MPAPAVYPARPRPLAAPEATQPPTLRLAVGCAGCGVRQYCALATPASASPPANCPFGPGPAGR